MGNLKVKYFLASKMLADRFTKSLQGAAFRKFRSDIQGIPEDTLDIDLYRDRPKEKFIPIPQECVEISDVNMDMRTDE